MTRVLFTGGGGAGMELLWRLLHEKYELYFLDINCENYAPIIPRERRNGTNSFDLLVPGIDEELAEDAWREHVLVPTPGYVCLMLDKSRAMSALREKGISVPRTWLTKPNVGRGSRGIDIIQEHLEGPEYSVCCTADQQGKLHGVVPWRVDKRNSCTIRGETEHQKDVSRTCEQIHKAFPTRGCYNVQGILTRDGFTVFEINPRFSGTTGLAIAAGVDPIAVWLGTQRSRRGLLPFTAGLCLQRTWHAELTTR